MLYSEIIAVCSGIHTKHINTLRIIRTFSIATEYKTWNTTFQKQTAEHAIAKGLYGTDKHTVGST
jgi:hypothetical protein